MRAESAWTASSTVPPSSGAACSAVEVGRLLVDARRCRISSASAWKSAFLATKSVSQSSSISAPPAAATRPLAVVALGPLADVLRTLDAQELDGLVEVAVGLLEGLLAVHHPGRR